MLAKISLCCILKYGQKMNFKYADFYRTVQNLRHKAWNMIDWMEKNWPSHTTTSSIIDCCLVIISRTTWTKQISTVYTLTKRIRSKTYNHKEFTRTLGDTKDILDNMNKLPCNGKALTTDTNHGPIVTGDVGIVKTTN